MATASMPHPRPLPPTKRRQIAHRAEEVPMPVCAPSGITSYFFFFFKCSVGAKKKVKPEKEEKRWNLAVISFPLNYSISSNGGPQKGPKNAETLSEFVNRSRMLLVGRIISRPTRRLLLG